MTEERDELDDILKDLEGGADGDNQGDNENLDSLKAQLAELKKQNAGLLNEAKSQRKKRQEADARVDKLTSSVSDVLKQRAAVGQALAGAAAPNAAETLVFDYDDDGNPVAKAEQIKSILSPDVKQMQERIEHLEAMLQESVRSQQAESEADKVINAIVGSDERYGPAYSKYQNARKWVEDKVVEYQRENNIGGLMTSGQALDYVFDDDLEADFAAKFPGINLERVVTAEDSQKHFKNTLASIANAMSPTRNDDDNKGRFKKVLSKPGSLGRSANAQNNMSLEERLSSLTPKDVLEMSDDNVKALERLLEKAE